MLHFSTIPSFHRGRSATRQPAPRPKPNLALGSAPTDMLLGKFIQTYIEWAQDYLIGARNDSDKSLKSVNSNLYYDDLYIECYYFCQQCKDHFRIAESLDYKYVPFAIGFLKDCILNQWQEYKTWMQCN